MIDLHCHLLPGVDDGPRTEGEALALAAQAVAAGTTVVACTPHHNAVWPTPPDAVAEGVERMRAKLRGAGIPLEVVGGAEVAIEQAVALDDATLAALRLGGGPYLLLESPFGPVGPELERSVDELMARGHSILLAHPERSTAFRDHPLRLRRLVARGVRCSITAGAFEARFGDATRWFALELLRDGLVHSIDSDAHDAELRPPGLRAGIVAAARHVPALEHDADRLTTLLPATMLQRVSRSGRA